MEKASSTVKESTFNSETTYSVIKNTTIADFKVCFEELK